MFIYHLLTNLFKRPKKMPQRDILAIQALKMNGRRIWLIDHPTQSERRVKQILTSLGVRYKYNHIIGSYIADFVIGKKILEVDGSAHDGKEEYDDRRSRFLLSKGYDVYRIRNEDISKENIRSILST